MIFVFPPTVVVSYSLPWLMLIKPKSCCFRGKHTGASHLFSSCFGLYFHVRVFVSRVILSLQRQMVMADFTPEFRQKIQDFYRRFLFPVELKNLRNRCMSMRVTATAFPFLSSRLATEALTPFLSFWLVRFSLRVRPWDNILLVTVLKGQNVSGIRKEGKKKDVLTEEISVIFLRSELLQRQKRSKETVSRHHTCSKSGFSN